MLKIFGELFKTRYVVWSVVIELRLRDNLFPNVCTVFDQINNKRIEYFKSHEVVVDGFFHANALIAIHRVNLCIDMTTEYFLLSQ